MGHTPSRGSDYSTSLSVTLSHGKLGLPHWNEELTGLWQDTAPWDKVKIETRAKAVGTFPPLTSQVLHVPGWKVTSGVWVPILPNSSAFKFCWCGVLQWHGDPPQRGLCPIFHSLQPLLGYEPYHIAYGSTQRIISNPLSANGFSTTAISFLEL